MAHKALNHFLAATSLLLVLTPGISKADSDCGGLSLFTAEDGETPLIKLIGQKAEKADEEERNSDEQTPLESSVDALVCASVKDEEGKSSTFDDLKRLIVKQKLNVTADFNRAKTPQPVTMIVNGNSVSFLFNNLLSNDKNGEAGEVLLNELYLKTVDGEKTNGRYMYLQRTNKIVFAPGQ